MKDNILEDIARKTKLHFYRSVFREFEDSERSLSLMETMLLEIIDYLDRPSINDLVNFLHVSQPNMSYKVNVLEKKGYIRKVRNDSDGRFLHLVLTDEYYSYKKKKNEFTKSTLDKVEESLSEEEKNYLYKSLYLVDKVLEDKLKDYINDVNSKKNK